MREQREVQLNKSEARTGEKLTPATKYDEKKVIKSKHGSHGCQESSGTGEEPLSAH